MCDDCNSYPHLNRCPNNRRAVLGYCHECAEPLYSTEDYILIEIPSAKGKNNDYITIRVCNECYPFIKENLDEDDITEEL